MSYSWQIPGPPSGVGSPSPSAISSPTTRTALGGLFDQEIDPITLDYIDTDNGEWSETADSRSIVMCMIDLRLGQSYAYPNDGTRIAELLESGEPVTPAVVVAEITRVMAILEIAGVLTNFSIRATDDNGNTLVDDGRFTPELRWTDLASGSPVDLAYSPVTG